ncbi:MAG: hypothetical protein HKN32_09305 [Flavobacteriales bacterium]|nr:hypothetical protein [Flavobacteriales bacterium]
MILLVIFLYGGYTKRKNLPNHPEYAYFLWGMWAKILGGLAFACIYIFYYGQADTTSYYECALAYTNMFTSNFSDFLVVYLGGGTEEIKSLFNHETGSPMWYMFSDDKTRMVIKLLVPLLLLGGKSYFVTTVLVSAITYGGLWALFRMFVSYFPEFARNLAIGILFMPSVIFWGGGILKDSFTLAATCFFIVATDRFVQRKGSVLIRWIMLFASGFVILSIKPYILIILLPGTLVWYFYARIKRIKNKFFRYIIVPFIYTVVIAGTYGVLTTLSDSLGKFAPDKALQTAVVIQQDLKQEYYDGNSFDIGNFDPTLPSILAKAPLAIEAGLFRPYLWESKNLVMILSGLENLVILGVTLAMILLILFGLAKGHNLLRLIADYPVLFYSLMFSLLFAFMIGLTTSNFGALVRFKIPLIPPFMATMMVILGHLRLK